jgi:hypothetical protein
MAELRAYLQEQGREEREGQGPAGTEQQLGTEGSGRREQRGSTCTARRGAAGGTSSLARRETSGCGHLMLAGGLPFHLCVVFSSISMQQPSVDSFSRA